MKSHLENRVVVGTNRRCLWQLEVPNIQLACFAASTSAELFFRRWKPSVCWIWFSALTLLV